MEDYTQYKRHFSKLGWAYAIGTVVIIAAQMLTVFIVNKINPNLLQDMNVGLICSVLPMYLIGMPVLVALSSKVPGQAPERHKMTPGQFLLALIMCYTIMFASNLVGTFLTTVIGFLKGSTVDNAILDVATGTSLWMNAIYMVIFAPIMEELIFRKLIVDKTRRFGEGVAVLLSGVMFGLFHGNLSQFAYAFTIGMFLAFLYLRTGNLKITIGIHMIINFMGSILGVLLLRAIDYDGLMELVASGNYNEQTAMEYIMNNLAGWMIYMLYLFAVLAVVIAGVVLLIVFRGKFRLKPGEIVLEKGRRFSTVMVNTGMIVFCLVWVVQIILQLVL